MSTTLVGPPSKALLARYLQRAKAARVQASDAIPKRQPGAMVEASDAQQQLFLHAELANGVPLYNEPVTVHYHGQLNVRAFEQAFNEILRRHEAWRTSYSLQDGGLIHQVHSELQVQFPVSDLRHLPEKQRESQALAWATEDSKAPFDLSNLPIFRFRLVRLRDDEYRLYLTLHHIIFDGVSLYRIFLPELQACYSAYARGEEPQLTPLAVQYSDYCAWNRKWLNDGGADEQLRYWKEQLSGDLPVLNLPLDRPRPEVSTHAGAMITFVIPPGVTEEMKNIGQAQNASLYMSVLAAFHVFLYHLTGQSDQMIGSASSSRKHSATQGMLGLFLNTIVLRTRFSADDSFLQLLTKVRDTTLAALSNDDVPFSTLVNLFDKKRVPGMSPLFQVMFSLEPPLSPLGDGWKFTQMDVETGISKFDLHLELDEREEGLIGRFIYSSDIFNESTIHQAAHKWSFLLAKIAGDPRQTVAQLCNNLSTEIAAPKSSISFFSKFCGFWSKSN